MKSLDAAHATLEAYGDWFNATHALYLQLRRLLLIGRLEEVGHTIAQLDPTNLPPVLKERFSSAHKTWSGSPNP